MTARAPAPEAERLRLGASSWSAPSWEGVFYPAGMDPGDYLAHYATRFDTVEIDATFYRSPTEKMVDGWRRKTPDGFLFAAKVPQVITHDKMLEGCGEELGTFLKVIGRLGDRLGPLLFQFRYFKKGEFPDPKPFIDRLERFLPALPREMRFAVEVRNKSFVVPRLLDVLRAHRVALAFIDHPWFHRIDQMIARPETLTADFGYLRWLGDRYAIETKTTTWDRLIVDRRREMAACMPSVRALLERTRSTVGYFNNHYAGYAVGSILLFRELWEDQAAG